MNILLEEDERKKLVFFLMIIFIIQAIFFYFLNMIILKEINNRYIKQNIAIVGETSKYNKKLTKDIIPIVTGKTLGDYNTGKSIMSKYSYSEGLDININPLFYNTQGDLKIGIILISLFSFILSLIGLIFIMNPLFKQIKCVTIRAENIVENKFGYNKEAHEYKGSLEKFIYKFNLMEDRIRNNIILLKNEKINLKNVINDISHQLKTPLTALDMYNDILKDYKEMNEEDIDNFINASKEQLDRMNWLVKTLLKYARLESNAVEYRKEYFSLNNTIEESINPLKIKANEKNQSLVFNYKKDIKYLHDRKWISEAISNIVKNAIEHTENYGKILITIDETPISIVIKIKDNGEGIEKSEIKKIFNRFYKGQNSLNPSSIGIGLCLSKTIIQDHNGDITVESELEVGSTFCITFLKTTQ